MLAEYGFRFVLGLATAIAALFSLIGYYGPPKWRRLDHIGKPLATICIIAVAVGSLHPPAEATALLLILGLLFSLGGDIALLFPKGFIIGLVCFLLTHLSYSASFFSMQALPVLATGGFPIVAASLVLIGLLWRRLSSSLRFPVALYIAGITLMAMLAVGRAVALPTPPHLSAAVGAILFFISDGTLAIDRFYKPFHAARALVRATYFTGQFFIAVSI